MTSVVRGRPPASSRETLADAASELFLEQGYESTTVADITRRAGVSRSSFFNYFDGKAATIWFALDEVLATLAVPTPGDPAPQAGGRAATALTATAVAAALGQSPPHTLALAIANAEVMGVAGELATGRALRQAALGDALAGALVAPQPVPAGGLFTTGVAPASAAPFAAEIAGAARAAAVFAAIWRWAERGAGTHRLDDEIAAALATAGPGAAGHAARGRGALGDPLRVAVIGSGAIGARVITELAAGRITGAQLTGVVTRRAGSLAAALAAGAGAGPGAGPGVGAVTDFGADIDRALAESDLVVECAGIAAARDAGSRVIAGGKTLLLVSIGALAEPQSRAQLTGGPGTLRLASGAIGGLDILASAARADGIAGGISHASLTSTKAASSLVQPWMSDDVAAELRAATAPVALFTGTVAEAVELFPGSLNVACALAHATGLWDETTVRLIGDPAATRTTHEIAAGGAAGEYRFSVTNAVSEANPTSSAVVAEAVLRGIAELARPNAAFL